MKIVFRFLLLLPAAALAACNPDGTELCCDSVVETNCLSFSRPSWGGVSATNDCDGASFVLTGLQSGSVRYEIVQSWTPKPGYDGKCPDPEPAFTVRADVVPEVAWTLQSGDWTTNGTGEVATMPRSAGVCSARCEFTVSWPATACSGSGSETVSSSAVFTNAVVVSEIPPPRICTLNDHHSPHGFLVDLACPDEGWTPSIVPGADGANAIITQIDRTAKTFRAQGTHSGLDAKAVVTAECGEGFTPFDVVALGDLRLGNGCGCKPGATDSTDEDADATAYETMVGKPEEGAKATLEQDYEPEKWGEDVLWRTGGGWSPASGSCAEGNSFDLAWALGGSVSNIVDSWFDCEPDLTRADDEPKRRLILAVAYFTGLEFQGSSVEGQESPVSATADFGNGSSKRCAYVCAPGDTLDIKAVTVIPEGRELSLAKTAEQPEDKHSAMNVGAPTGSGNHWTLKVPDDCAEGTFTLELKDPGHSCVTEEYDILVQGCGCGTCDEFGKGTRKTHSLDISFGLGRTATGSALPPLRVRSDDLSADFEPPLPPIRRYVNGELVTPQASSPVSYKAAAGGGGYTLDTAEGSVSVSSSASSIQVSYTRTGESDPFVEYGLVKTNGVATLTETRNGVARRVDRWTQNADGSWRLDTLDPDGTVLESEELLVSTPLLERRRAGGVLRETVWEEVAGHGRVVVRETVGEGADARSTVTRPFASGPAAGLVRSEVRPDGSWTLRDYDAQRRPVSEIAPFGDTAPVLDATGAVTGWEGPVVRRTWSYAPVDPRDDGSVEPDSPRTTVVAVGSDAAGWTETSRSYAAYFETGAERVALSERAAAAGAAYGATGALRSETRTHAPGTPHAGRLASSLSEQGMLTRHAYAFGAWDPASPHEFTSGIDDGGFLLETSFTTPAAHPDGVPRKTTLERSVRNARGDLVYTATRLLLEGGETALLSWTLYGRDAAGREIRRESSDGSLVETSWACCGPEWRRDETGIVTDYAYDAAGRLVLEQRGTVQTEHRYDAAGREVETIRRGLPSGGRPATTLHPATRGYDALGRLAWSEGEDGIRLEYRYGTAPGGGETRTVIRGAGTPLATTNVTVSLRDGRITRTLFNGTAQTTFVYAPLATTEFLGSAGTNSLRWTRTEDDLLDREVRLVRPGFGGTVLATERFYNGTNQLVRERTEWAPVTNLAERTPLSQTLLDYDNWGAVRQTTEDRDFNGTWTPGTDRALANAENYVEEGGMWWRVSEQSRLREDGTELVFSRVLEQSSGFGATADTEIGPACLVSRRIYVDARGNISTNALWRHRAAASELSLRADPASVIPYVRISVDGLIVTNRSAQGVATSFRYDTLGRTVAAVDLFGNATTSGYDTYGRRVWSEDPAGARTQYRYDALGRLVETVDALGVSSFATYDARDRKIGAWGSVYPELDCFDEFGNRTDLLTWRGTDAIADFADLLAKQPEMDRTQWFYDEATGLPVEKRYADGSAVRYTYTPNGKPLRTTQADGSWTEGLYDAGGDFTGSVCSDASLDWSQTLDVDGFVSSVSNEIAATRYDRDETGLVTNEWVSVGPFEHEIVRTYDELGRPASLAIKGTDYLVTYRWSTNGLLEGVDFPGASVHYDYTPDALDAGYSVAVSNGATIARNVTRNAQRRGLVDRIENRAGTNALPSFVYAYDLLGRPVTRNGDSFGYNDRSEVVSAQFGTNGVADLYAYDSIGNRISSRERGVESSYEANELNEYASISTLQPFNFSTNILAYDINGNLLTNGVWSYAYDAQNRLSDVWSNGIWVLSNAYDANARRVIKRTQEGTRYFLYDGWNLIQETFITAAGETNVSHYVWGKDLSGTFQGAGGVGGLFAVLCNNEVFIPSYDNNGNVVSYSDSEGVSVCELRYDAYGDVSSKNGINIDVSFQFSTKYYDGEIQLLYYGFRFYTPIAGRWMTRDPIGESDCLNLCLFVWNNGLFGIDCYGLWKKVNGTGHEWEAEKNDTLWGLASKSEYGGSGKNWICLWPVGDTKDHGYPNIHPCDRYDASNLAAPAPGATTLSLELEYAFHENHSVAYHQTPRVVDANWVPGIIQSTSGEGATPISSFFMGGHGFQDIFTGRHGMSGDLVSGTTPNRSQFEISRLVALNQSASFVRAKQKKGPIRCWFTRDATVRFVGCSTGPFLAEDFSQEVLRRNARAIGTTMTIAHSNGRLFYGFDLPRRTVFVAPDPLTAPVWRTYNATW